MNVFSGAVIQRRREAAIRHSRFDKSDPHTFNRAMSHAHNAVCSFEMGADRKPVHVMYDADTFPCTRPLDPRWAPLNVLRKHPMTEVNDTAYKNVTRP